MAQYEARKVLLKDLNGRYIVPWTGSVESVNGVKPGPDGSVVVDAVPPSITAKATTLPAGQNATVVKGGTDKAPIFTFNIPKGDKGDRGVTGIRGTQWYSGAAMTGTSTTPTIFDNSGLTSSLVGDYYLNTSTGFYYRCATAGNASQAKWAYAGNFAIQKYVQDNFVPKGTIPVVRTINGIKANTSGALALTDYVNSITAQDNNLVCAKKDGSKVTIPLGIKKINGASPDASGNVQISAGAREEDILAAVDKVITSPITNTGSLDLSTLLAQVTKLEAKVNELESKVYLVESGVKNGAWYRKYSDGHIEQGGHLMIKTQDQVVPLAIPFNNANYTVLGSGSSLGSSGYPNGLTLCYELTNKNFKAFIGDYMAFKEGDLHWIAIGE